MSNSEKHHLTVSKACDDTNYRLRHGNCAKLRDEHQFILSTPDIPGSLVRVVITAQVVELQVWASGWQRFLCGEELPTDADEAASVIRSMLGTAGKVFR